VISFILPPKSTVLSQNCQFSHFSVNQLFSADATIMYRISNFLPEKKKLKEVGKEKID
jgi:hypothetical protein